MDAIRWIPTPNLNGRQLLDWLHLWDNFKVASISLSVVEQPEHWGSLSFVHYHLCLYFSQNSNISFTRTALHASLLPSKTQWPSLLCFISLKTQGQPLSLLSKPFTPAQIFLFSKQERSPQNLINSQNDKGSSRLNNVAALLEVQVLPQGGKLNLRRYFTTQINKNLHCILCVCVYAQERFHPSPIRAKDSDPSLSCTHSNRSRSTPILQFSLSANVPRSCPIKLQCLNSISDTHVRERVKGKAGNTQTHMAKQQKGFEAPKSMHLADMLGEPTDNSKMPIFCECSAAHC